MKPLLLWPRPLPTIATMLGRGPDDFIVIDTNDSQEFQKLYRLRPDTPIFDPFPASGTHYRQFIAHIEASQCRYRIAGLAACRDVLRTLDDPSLSRTPIDEILLALGYLEPAGGARGRLRAYLAGLGGRRGSQAAAGVRQLASGVLGLVVNLAVIGLIRYAAVRSRSVVLELAADVALAALAAWLLGSLLTAVELRPFASVRNRRVRNLLHALAFVLAWLALAAALWLSLRAVVDDLARL